MPPLSVVIVFPVRAEQNVYFIPTYRYEWGITVYLKPQQAEGVLPYWNRQCVGFRLLSWLGQDLEMVQAVCAGAARMRVRCYVQCVCCTMRWKWMVHSCHLIPHFYSCSSKLEIRQNKPSRTLESPKHVWNSKPYHFDYGELEMDGYPQIRPDDLNFACRDAAWQMLEARGFGLVSTCGEGLWCRNLRYE